MKKFLLLICRSSAQEKGCLKDKLDKAQKALLVTGEDADGTVKTYDGESLLDEAKATGVFVYSPGNIVYANDKYIAVTATKDGEVCLNTRHDGMLEDVVDGTVLEVTDNKAVWPSELNLCRLFRWKS